jgi:hypothetical protein
MIVGVEAHGERAHHVRPPLDEGPVAAAVLIREGAVHPPGRPLRPVDGPGLRDEGGDVLDGPLIRDEAALLGPYDRLLRVVAPQVGAQRVAGLKGDLIAGHRQIRARTEELAQEDAPVRVFQTDHLDDAAHLDAGHHQRPHLSGLVVRRPAGLMSVEVVVRHFAHAPVRRAHASVEGPQLGARRPVAAQGALVESALVQDGHDAVAKPLLIPPLGGAHVETGDGLQEDHRPVIGVVAAGRGLHALKIRPTDPERRLAGEREAGQHRENGTVHFVPPTGCDGATDGAVPF